MDALELVSGLDPEQPDAGVGHRVECTDDRAEQRDVDPLWPGQGQHRPLRADEGQVLRHHLADHHVEEHDDGQGEGEAEGGAHPVGQADRLQGRFEQLTHGRLGHVAEGQRGHRHAELSTGQLQRQLARGVEGDLGPAAPVLGEGFELGAA